MAHMTYFRKVGGSIMLRVPAAVLDQAGITVDQAASVRVDAGRLIVEPSRVPEYSLEDLLAQCDLSAPPPEEDRAWDQAAAVGEELL